MSRRIRIDPPGGVHHVMNRGVDRGTVFFDDDARLEFGRQLEAAHERFGATVLAYCLMDNHYHLLLRTEPGTISPVMQHAASRFAQETNRRLGRDGPLFRGRFHAIPVTTDAYLLAAFRYIHQNPIDVVGVRSIDRYRWSSYRTYLRLRSAPPFLDTTLLDGMLGGPETMRAFHQVRGMADLVHHDVDTADTLRQLIDLAIGVVALDLEDRALAGRLDRTVIHLLDGIPGVDPHILTELRGADRSTNADTLARRRAAERLTNDPVVARILRFIADQLAPSDEVRPQSTSSLAPTAD